MKEQNIKEKDVFIVGWKDRQWGDQKGHCFEGILIAYKDGDELKFYDTYWNVFRRDSESDIFTFAQMMDKFNVKYYCNLDELEKIEKYNDVYYDDKDIFTLHDQHACMPSCIYTFIKKGTQRSKEKMLESVDKKISDYQRTIEYNTRCIELLKESGAKIRNGDLEVYI